MIRADFHTHTCFSTDSETPVREMIEQAAECGLKTLCITDHWDEDYPNGLEKMCIRDSAEVLRFRAYGCAQDRDIETEWRDGWKPYKDQDRKEQDRAAV